MKIRSVRGTHDLYGPELVKYKVIESVVTNKAEINSFSKLQTPIFEFTELFSKPLGIQSDVVLKEMYSFKDRNDDFLTLRPEYTTPMIRAAITNNLLNNLPLKLFGLGPMFRRERPQKGRFRQFNQINFEIFGTSEFMADLELIVLANDILKTLLPNSKLILNLNTLGEKNNLSKYRNHLSKYFDDYKTKLSKESREKIQTNPLRILDSKNDDDIEISKNAPIIFEFISNEQKKHFSEIKKGLDFSKISYNENFRLVRGLDYYCGTVFEFKSSELGSQDTLLGGGRYDGLIGLLGGPDIPGIGWAAGIERISMLMDSIEDKSKRINVRKIISLEEAINKPYSKVTIELKENPNLKEVMNILSKNGETKVNFVIKNKNKIAHYSLQNTRKFDLNHLKALKAKDYVEKIIV
mgnify:CR=1 FL=1